MTTTIRRAYIFFLAYLLILILTSFCSYSLNAQVRSEILTGVVTDSSGNPIAGATITVKNKLVNAITDKEGVFAINVSGGEELEVSHVAFITQTIQVPAKKELLNIRLKIKSNDEIEVIVEANTGYQTVKPNEINGSVTLIDNKLLNQQTGTNILERLKGVTNGLIFNSGKYNSNGNATNDISIRGLSTINGPVQPLIVLDNFPYEGAIENINPNDIESVTILKDAAAASIWGARAGNGVIVITSKQSRYNERLKVDFNSNLLFTTSEDLYSVPQMPISDYVDIETNLFNRGYFDDLINNTTTRPPLSPVVEMLLNRRDGLLSASDSASLISQYKLQDSRKQFEKYFQKWGLTQQYSLSLRGGSSQFSWLLAGDHNRIINTDRSTSEKINIHIDNNFRPIKNLAINVNAYYTSRNSKSGMPSYKTLSTMKFRYIPYLSFVGADGQALTIDQYRKGFIDTVGQGRLLDWNYYPYEDYKHDYRSTQNQEIIARMSLNYTIIWGLQFSATYQFQKGWGSTDQYADMNSFYLRDLINQFTKLSYSAKPDIYQIPKGDMVKSSASASTTQNLRGQLTYSKVWLRHSINVLAGGELRDAQSGGTGSFTVYGYQQDPLSVGTVDFYNTYPTIISGSFRRIPGTPGITSTNTNRFVSVYANASYIYNKKYSVSGSFRKDASNVFGATTNDKWNPLWSAGAGWLISDEHFFRKSVFERLRLRISYGLSGNLDQTKTPLPVSSASTNSVTNFPVLRISSLNNPSLRWEKSRQINIGIDFTSANNIVTGSIEYYNKKGIDLYGATPYDYTAWGGGGGVITKNVANMKGNGIDITFTTTNIDRAVKWRTSVIYNYNTSKTTKYYTDASKDFYNINDGNLIVPVIGKPLYGIAAYNWGGLNENGDPQGYIDGILSTDYGAIRSKVVASGLESGSLSFIGPSAPTHFGSIINNLSWKGFSLSVNIMFEAGYFFRKTSFSSVDLITSGIGYGDYTDRWQKAGDELRTSVPKFVYNDYAQFFDRDDFYRSSAVNVLRGDNVRLHYIDLSYSFKHRGLSKNLTEITLYSNASNLGILWRANKQKVDPNYPGTYPPPKQYTVGLRFSF